MKHSLRVKITIIFSSIQLNLSLYYRPTISSLIQLLLTCTIGPSYYFINQRLLKQELFSAISKSIRPSPNQIKGFQPKSRKAYQRREKFLDFREIALRKMSSGKNSFLC